MNAPPDHVIAGHRLVRRFGPGPAALDTVSFAAAAGTFTAIMGASGSGKSTLLHLLSGLDTPDAGEVSLMGRSLSGLDDTASSAIRHEHMGFVFQGFNLLPGLSALENIRLPHKIGRGRRHVDRDWETHLIDSLGLADIVQRPPLQLSGGQQQRVAIARALSHRPAAVFADEPTGNLDLNTGQEVLRIFTALVAVSGTAVLMVTHDPAAASAASRVVLLRDGKVAHDGPGRDPMALAQLMLGGAR
jgi:putative ABC transport system ATP-binding protein